MAEAQFNAAIAALTKATSATASISATESNPVSVHEAISVAASSLSVAGDVGAWQPSPRQLDRLLFALLALIKDTAVWSNLPQSDTDAARDIVVLNHVQSGKLRLQSFHALCSQLRPGADHTFLKEVLELLKTLLTSQPILSFTDGVIEDRIQWNQFVSIVSVLPDKIANAFKTVSFDPFYEAPSLSKFIMSDIGKQCVGALHLTNELETSAALLLTKLCRLNHYKQFSSVLVDCYLKNSDARYGNVVLKMDLDQLQKLAVCLVQDLAARKCSQPDNYNLTCAILIGLSYVDLKPVTTTGLGSLEQKLDLAFTKGMHGYLSTTSALKRSRGMLLGECVMGRLRPGIPLSFELPESDEVAFLRSLMVKPREDSFETFREVDVVEAVRTLDIKVSASAKPVSMSALKVKELDPDELTDDMVSEDSEESDSDSEEDLEPLPQPSTRVNSKKPVYLRDCLANLRIEDPEVQETALQTLPNLITQADATDLIDVFPELCQKLLTIQNSYDWEDFDLFLQESVVCLGVRLPKMTAKVLNESLVGDERALMGRMAVLRYICFIVTVGTKRGVLIHENTSDLVRKSSESSAFINSLPEFFFPLIDNFRFIYSLYLDSNKMSHNALFDSYLKALSLILKCSENSIHSLRMSRDLFELLPNVDYSRQDSHSRDSVLLAFNIVLNVVPPGLFADEMGGRDVVDRILRFLGRAREVENDPERVMKVDSIEGRILAIS
ncbi:TEL2, telomere maintenance protein 2 [Podochytrium sp. JEL0797]|nr:TEL2, telomere maintenance protein 2 [Podochytrium sp. JEL0797]